MGINKVLKNKKVIFKKSLVIFFFILIQLTFISVFFRNLDSESIIIAKSTYYRFNIFLLFSISLKKILEGFKLIVFQNKNYNYNYWLFSVLSLIMFNSLVPITIDNEFGNLFLLIIFFITVLSFYLNSAIQKFINDIQLSYYKSLFVGLSVLIVLFDFNLLLFNLLILILIIFRKKINIIVINYEKTKFIHNIKFFKGDFLINF